MQPGLDTLSLPARSSNGHTGNISMAAQSSIERGRAILHLFTKVSGDAVLQLRALSASAAAFVPFDKVFDPMAFMARNIRRVC